MKQRIFWTIVVSLNLFIMGLFAYGILFKVDSDLPVKSLAVVGFLASLILFLEQRDYKHL